MSLIRLGKFTAIATALFSLLSAVGIPHHLAELFVHFRLQYLFASFALLLLFVWLRQTVYAAAMFVSLAVSVWLVAPWYLADAPSGGSAELKLMHVNVHSSNQAHDRLIEYIQAEDPDIVFLQEVSPAWANSLTALSGSHPYSHVKAMHGNFGIAVYSRLKLDSVRHIDSPPLGHPTIVASALINDAPVTFVSSHPMIPIGQTLYTARNAQLDSLERLIGSLSGHVVFSGDLNASPWDPALTEFQENTGLLNASQGSGLRPTWPMFFVPAAIPIDHVMVSPGIGVAEYRTGRRTGSDHLPLVVTLTL